MEKITDFTKRLHISRTFSKTDKNPNNPTWKDADHYHVSLHYNGRILPGYFSKGKGHKGVPPTASEVLTCLSSDAVSIENSSSFDEWADEFGYDKCSIKEWRALEQRYKAAVINTKGLATFLGPIEYENLLYNTEE